MAGRGRQTAQSLIDDRFAEHPQVLHRLAVQPLGQRGTGGNRRGTTPDLERRFNDYSAVDPGAELENVAAGGVFYLHGQRGRGENAGMARIFEVIEQRFRVQAHPAMFQWNMEVGSVATPPFSVSPLMNRTLIVVAGVLHREGKLLIGQRMADDRHALKWEFPGGKVEIGETPKEALARELREELAIEAVVGREIARYEQATRRRSPLLLLFHAIESYVGEPQGVTFEQIRWEDPAKLPDYDFLDGDLDFVRRLAMGRLRPFS